MQLRWQMQASQFGVIRSTGTCSTHYTLHLFWPPLSLCYFNEKGMLVRYLIRHCHVFTGPTTFQTPYSVPHTRSRLFTVHHLCTCYSCWCGRVHTWCVWFLVLFSSVHHESLLRLIHVQVHVSSTSNYRRRVRAYTNPGYCSTYRVE